MVRLRASSPPRPPNLIDQWRADGSSRIDLNLDGKIDAPGAAVMDTAWSGIALAVMQPVLGPLTQNLEQMIPLSNTPRSTPAGTATCRRT